MAEEPRGVLRGDGGEGWAACFVQRVGGAGGDAAQLGLHLGPSGFDRTEVGVAFHGWTEDRIGVGGGIVDRVAHPERHHRHEALKAEGRAGIEAVLRALGPPWSGLPVVLEASSGISGRHPDNVVNRITKLGNGVQIEQPANVRKDARVRDAVAQAVADVYLRQGACRPDPGESAAHWTAAVRGGR